MRFNTDRCQTPQSWVLPKGQAQTFASDTSGVLRIQSGRVWVTMNRSLQRFEPVARPAIADDDLFLDSTTSLPLRAGQTIVLESWSVGPAADATLVWEVVVSSAVATNRRTTCARVCTGIDASRPCLRKNAARPARLYLTAVTPLQIALTHC